MLGAFIWKLREELGALGAAESSYKQISKAGLGNQQENVSKNQRNATSELKMLLEIREHALTLDFLGSQRSRRWR